jgi:hypothetical protein
MHLRSIMGGYCSQPQIKVGSEEVRNFCFDSTQGYIPIKKYYLEQRAATNILLLFEKGKYK